MREIQDVGEIRSLMHEARCAGRSIGLVPTMGFLHAGHLRLVSEARGENDMVVTSIFVNPAQFGPSEDFQRYPRDIGRDRALATEAGVDVLFTPEPEAMYPGGVESQLVWIDPGPLAAFMEGASRPGHFRGVTTVVTKLFNMVAPDRAYFGQKDAQQAIIVTRMVQDLAIPVTIRVIPTVREDDGLALSSRNVYLSRDERAQAGVLHEALELAQDMIMRGNRDAGAVVAAMQALIEATAPRACTDYVAIADLETLRSIDGEIERDALVALAVKFGATRLIDNVIVRPTAIHVSGSQDGSERSVR